MIAGGTGWSYDFIFWDLPLWQVYRFEHCWLFEKQIDVSLKADIKAVVDQVTEMKRELT